MGSGGAYGVVVAVFQWGWGKSLIGLDETVPIVSFVPMFMFAVLFGLSMDYEVFLLSRIREEHLDGRDNRTSVINGIASTARVITSAALIMICVFAGFVLGPQPIVKMFGVGLATAVLVDATIVRVILVPATMRLLGDANWWMPRWLDRVLPRLDIEGTGGLPAPSCARCLRPTRGRRRRPTTESPSRSADAAGRAGLRLGAPGHLGRVVGRPGVGLHRGGGVGIGVSFGRLLCVRRPTRRAAGRPAGWRRGRTGAGRPRPSSSRATLRAEPAGAPRPEPG